MSQPLYRVLSIVADLRAASRGPVPYGKRVVRRESHKALARFWRRVL